MTSDFWKSKRVVLLGGASLIGTHLARALIEKGVRSLRVVDDLSAGKHENVEKLDLEFWWADLRDYRSSYRAVTNRDIVFHLASQHGGRGYVAGHKVELYDNLSLDSTIFRACAEVGVEKVIFSSSACAYPVHIQMNPEEELYLSEDLIDYSEIVQPDGAYGVEKLVAEQMLDAYIERGCFKGCSTRSFTVYGELMGESHAICALIAKTLIQMNPYEIWGQGNEVRNWTYVSDNVQGALLAAEKLDRGAVNIGVEDRLTPDIAAEKIWELMGWRPQEVQHRPDKPVGIRNRVADASKLKSLGWTPKVSFEEGLKRTIDWYTSTHDVEELRETLERKLTER